MRSDTRQQKNNQMKLTKRQALEIGISALVKSYVKTGYPKYLKVLDSLRKKLNDL